MHGQGIVETSQQPKIYYLLNGHGIVETSQQPKIYFLMHGQWAWDCGNLTAAVYNKVAATAAPRTCE